MKLVKNELKPYKGFAYRHCITPQVIEGYCFDRSVNRAQYSAVRVYIPNIA